MSGKLIVVEGIEGAGKSSIVERMVSWLQEVHDVDVTVFREPGSTPIGEAVRTLIKHPDAAISVSTQTELLWLARSQLLNKVVLPMLEKGEWVILDRYWMSTLAYQWDYYKESNIYSTVGAVIDKYTVPDFMVYLDVQPDIAKKRCMSGDGRGTIPDKNDDASLLTFKIWHRRYAEVINVYNSLIDADRKIKVIDANQDFSSVADDVLFALNEVI